MSGRGQQRSVFIGNISWETSEDELRELFSKIGPVVSFRFVYDRDTGKPRGYGFCEYQDHHAAESARRNLDGKDINGRKIKVDFAENDSRSSAQQNVPSMPTAADSNPAAMEVDTVETTTPSILTYRGTSVPFSKTSRGDPSESSSETIQSVLSTLSAQQLCDIVYTMQLCIQQHPEKTKEILMAEPSLAMSLLEIVFHVNAAQSSPQSQGFNAPAQFSRQENTSGEENILAQLIRMKATPEQIQQLLNLTPQQLETLPPELKNQVQQLQQQAPYVLQNILRGLQNQ